MTNEEAIRCLKEDKALYETSIKTPDGELLESLDMAISSLRAWEKVLQELEILIRGCDIMVEENDYIPLIMLYGGKRIAYQKAIEVIKQKLAKIKNRRHRK